MTDCETRGKKTKIEDGRIEILRRRPEERKDKREHEHGTGKQRHDRSKET